MLDVPTQLQKDYAQLLTQRDVPSQPFGMQISFQSSNIHRSSVTTSYPGLISPEIIDMPV